LEPASIPPFPLLSKTRVSDIGQRVGARRQKRDARRQSSAQVAVQKVAEKGA
jgi:hypothetical protein